MKFVDELPNKRYAWLPIVAELKTRPGMWAEIESEDKKKVRLGWQGLKQQGCEVTVRDGVLYARWPE